MMSQSPSVVSVFAESQAVLFHLHLLIKRLGAHEILASPVFIGEKRFDIYSKSSATMDESNHIQQL